MHDEIPNTINKLLRNGWTIAALAGHLGCSRRTVYRLRGGDTRNPRLNVYHQLMRLNRENTRSL